MNNEQLDSQLSAMFDDELPQPECELLARRLARDEALKARWGRYAVIAACIRMERGGEAATSAGAARASARQTGVSSGEARLADGESRLPPLRLNGGIAGRVSRIVAAEPALLAGSGVGRSARGLANPAVRRWWQPVAGGTAVAAGVAAAAILWLRAGSPDAPMVAQTPVLARTASPVALPQVTPASVVQAGVPGAKVRSVAASASGPAAASAPDSFVVPPPAPSTSFAPPVELANFVVAHSEYSMPLLRRSALSGLVTDEAPTDDAGDNRPTSGDGSSSGNTPHADSPR